MEKYRLHFSDKDFILSFIEAIVFISIALVTQFYASNYATLNASNSVTDIILSSIPVFNIDIVFVYGAILLILIIIVVCLRNINYLPFVAKSIAAFTLIRSFFITLTHISTYPVHSTISSPFFSERMFNGIFNGDGLFFSGHTGLPFLMALIFWQNKVLRIIFLSFSVLFAVVVLLGHVHYSIDVFSAFFITYTIFCICKVLYKKDLKLFLS